MASLFLLDSPILIDFLNDIPEAIQLVQGFKAKQLAVSIITYTEVLVGIENGSQRQIFDDFLDECIYFSIEKSTAIITADLKRQFRWKLPDAFQAAIAVEHKMTLLTRNSKDFNPAIHKFVKIPYKLK